MLETFPEIVNESSVAHVARKIFELHGVNDILDAGCGKGRDSKYFCKSGFRRVVGLDVDHSSLEQAMLIIKDCPENLELIQGDITNLCFEDCSFDAVFGNRSYHIVGTEAERLAAMDECYRILRPGGVLFQIVFSRTDKFYGRGDSIEPHTFANKRGTAIHYFDEAELRSWMGRFDIRLLDETEDLRGGISLGASDRICWYVAGIKRHSI